MTAPALPLLTTSRLKTARACQRLHRYQYGLGYRPVTDADALRFGTLWHLGMEAWWTATEHRLDAAIAAIQVETDPYDLARCEALLVGYDARWRDEAELYDVLAVEAEFRAPLVNPETGRASVTWQLGGKVDVVIRERATGRVGICEHKTTSEDMTPGTDYWRRLRMDPQVSIYYTGGQVIAGESITFCLYDVVKKPGLRPGKATPVEKRQYKKDGSLYATQREQDETSAEYRERLLAAIAEAPNAYFARSEVVRLEGEVAEATFDIWQLAQQLREAARLGRYPRNPYACLQYGRTCPFLSVCSGETSLDDETQFRRTEIHPELNDAAEAA